MRKRMVLTVILILIIIIPVIYLNSRPEVYTSIPYTFELANDKQHIAWIFGGDVVYYDYTTGNRIFEYKTELSYTKDITISPNNQLIAVTGYIGPDQNPNQLLVFDIQLKKIVFQEEFNYLKSESTSGWDPYLRFSDDGTTLFARLHQTIDKNTVGQQVDQESLILYNTSSWEKITNKILDLHNGYSNSYLTAQMEWLFYQTGEIGNYRLINLFNGTELLINQTVAISNDLEFQGGSWLNDTVMRQMYLHINSTYIFDRNVVVIDYNILTNQLHMVGNWSDIYIAEPRISHSSTYVMQQYSMEFNQIYRLDNGVNIYNITHNGQNFQDPCLNVAVVDTSRNCPVSLFHQWGRYNDLIVYSNHFQETDIYQLTVFDLTTQQILGIIGEQSTILH